ncbi:MAG: hypothetical protein FJ126_00350 [Deltaproteobacteria bacterium]|nr:hypothetical protein [Deltaproteobacteria bacterium]
MKTPKWLAGCLALILGGTLMGADLSYAQARGQGAWCPNFAFRGGGQGRGPGNVNCPNYPGFQRRQGPAWSGNPQGRGPRGSRGGGGGRFAPATSTPDGSP